jgi:hypothetical protein
MGDLDLAAMVLLREEPGALLRFVVGSRPVRAVAPEDATVPASAVRMDKLLRYEVEGEADPRWLHVEIQASPTSDMPRRMFDYWSRAFPRYERLSSLLVCLKPGRKRGEPLDLFTAAGVDGSEIVRFRFAVVRLWKLRAADLIASRAAGLLPLVPFAAGTSPDTIDEALKILDSVEPVRHRAELQAVLATFAGQVFPGIDWLGRMPEEILMENTFLRSVKAAGLRELLALQLRARLGADAEPLIARLPGCSEATLTRVGELIASVALRSELLSSLEMELARTTS